MVKKLSPLFICSLSFSMVAMEQQESEKTGAHSLLHFAALKVATTIDFGQKAKTENQVQKLLLTMPPELTEKTIEILENNHFKVEKIIIPYIRSVDGTGTYALQYQPDYQSFSLHNLLKKDTLFKKLPIANGCKCAMLSPDARYSIFLLNDQNESRIEENNIHIINNKTEKSLTLYSHDLKNISFLDNSSYLFLEFDDKTMFFTSLATLKKNRNFQKDTLTPINKIQPEGMQYASRIPYFYKASYGTWLKEFPFKFFKKFLELDKRLEAYDPSCASVNPSGEIFATGNQDGITLWDIQKGEKTFFQPLEQSNNPSCKLTKLQWTQDSTFFVYDSEGNTWKLQFLENNLPLAKLLREKLALIQDSDNVSSCNNPKD